MMGPDRAVILWREYQRALQRGGDVAEFGTFRGETARELLRYSEAFYPEKTLHIFDTFTGLPGSGQYAGSQEIVRETLTGLTRYRLYPGLFEEYLGRFDVPLCFAHVDADLYEGTRDALLICARALVPGGIIVADDYYTHWEGVTQAVTEFTVRGGWQLDYTPGVGQCILTRLM